MVVNRTFISKVQEIFVFRDLVRFRGGFAARSGLRGVIFNRAFVSEERGILRHTKALFVFGRQTNYFLKIMTTTPPRSSERGFSIDFTNVNLSASTNKNISKTILYNISGSLKPGRFTAIMGPSGSGKTSLLTVLAGRTKSKPGMFLSGLILWNGRVVENWSDFRRMCAFVEQDDLLFHTMTVRETLEFASELRLPRESSFKERMDRVDSVIAELGLKKCSETRIGNEKVRGVSGGERRRVSIAVEVLRGPPVMFLDEPTSGLDSFQSLRVATTIKDLALTGKTMVCSIHQPRSSIFSLFDDVFIMSEGRVMYSGAALGMVAYFSRLGHPVPPNYNPADFALDLVSVDGRSDDLEAETKARMLKLDECFQQSSAKAGSEMSKKSMPAMMDKDASEAISDDIMVSKKRRYEALRGKQFFLLSKRALRQKLRDKTQIVVPLITFSFFGLLLGFIYFQNFLNMSQRAIQDKSGLMFFLTLNLFFNGFLGQVAVFPKERDIVNRERSSKMYAVSPYFTSKLIADFPPLVFPWLFVTIIYFLASLRLTAEAYFQTVAICLLSYETAASMGLAISAASSSSEMALTLGMPLVLIFVLFSGFYANLDFVPSALNWIQYLSPPRWIFAALVNIHFKGIVFLCTSPTEGCIPTGEAFVARLGLQNDSVLRSALVLIGMIVALQGVGILILRFKTDKYLTPKEVVVVRS